MEILGSKNGTIKRTGDMKLQKRVGEDAYKIGQDMTPEQLKARMAEMSKDVDIEALAKQKEQEAKSKKAMEDSYAKWLDTPIEKEYVNEELVTPDMVIIRLFYYNESDAHNISIILTEEVKQSYHKVLPIARVLVSNYENLNSGDIVKLPAVYGKNVLSKEWEQYQKDIREQPSLTREYPVPPMYVGKLNEWVNYMYQRDPFSDTSMDDQHTFCIPARLLQTKTNK